MFITPRVVESATDPDKNELNVDEVDEADKAFLFKLVGLPAKQLEPFRRQPPSDVELVDGEPKRQEATKRAAGD